MWFEYSLVKWDVRNPPRSPSETSTNRMTGYVMECGTYSVRFGRFWVSSREIAVVFSLDDELGGAVEDGSMITLDGSEIP